MFTRINKINMKPREKLEKYGVHYLSGSELVAVILGSGIAGIDVFQLSKKVFSVIEEKKEYLQFQDLLAIKGIGKVKAMQIMASFELAKRYFVKNEIQIKNLGDVLDEVKEYRSKKQEYFVTLTLDGAGRLLDKRVITIGLIDQTLVHPREVFSQAIEERAHSIIFVHNHPSNQKFPSPEDKEVTKNLLDAAEILGIQVLDHIIITKDDYFSFRENNILS
ncbi:MAG: DNA repair protein RadC [Candidatus Altimarinota bacterium]